MPGETRHGGRPEPLADPAPAPRVGRLAAVVAEIEMEEFERVARVVPVFLWLWEHRDEVRRLLAQGASWHALAAALGRLGLVDLGGGPPRQEYCRAAWVRVVAFEALVPRGRPDGVSAGVAEDSPPAPAAVAPASTPRASPRPGIPASSLNAILARGKRTPLTEPSPLAVGSRPRREAQPAGDDQ